jgi:hypothetical protein
MLRSSRWIIYASCLTVLIQVAACKRESNLERTIQKELESGVRNDSLFLGLKFGMTMQEFYDHCWGLNKQGIVKEGPKNMSVEYIFKDSLNNPIAFNFYPHHRGKMDEKIDQFNTSFYYYAWALNKHLYSDKLIKMLVPVLMEWYGGNEPFEVTISGKKHIYKIDGNRMIDLFIFNESTVVATYTDLSCEKLSENNE